MKLRLARLLGCSAVWALAACSDAPNSIELRLYPCPLTGGLPTGVELEIHNRDAKGMEIGSPLTRQFAIGDGEAVFQDGYATVSYKPPEGTVTADITVTWTLASESVAASYGVTVPGLGSSISLESGECGDVGTTNTPTTTLDPTSGSGTSSTTSTVTDSTTTGTTETTGPGTDTDTTTSTGTTSSTTETTTTTSTTSTTDSTTDSTTGPINPMEGEFCPVNGIPGCEGGPGILGKLLFCTGNKWVPAMLGVDVCNDSPCAGLGLQAPQLVGCLGVGNDWSCACAETPESDCMETENECPEGTEGVAVAVCDGGKLYKAICPACDLVDDKPLCTVPPP